MRHFSKRRSPATTMLISCQAPADHKWTQKDSTLPRGVFHLEMDFPSCHVTERSQFPVFSGKWTKDHRKSSDLRPLMKPIEIIWSMWEYFLFISSYYLIFLFLILFYLFRNWIISLTGGGSTSCTPLNMATSCCKHARERLVLYVQPWVAD